MRNKSAARLDDVQVGGAGAADVDGDRVDQRALGERLDLHRHRGAEHERLPLALEVGHHLRARALGDGCRRRCHYKDPPCAAPACLPPIPSPHPLPPAWRPCGARLVAVSGRAAAPAVHGRERLCRRLRCVRKQGTPAAHAAAMPHPSHDQLAVRQSRRAPQDADLDDPAVWCVAGYRASATAPLPLPP